MWYSTARLARWVPSEPGARPLVVGSLRSISILASKRNPGVIPAEERSDESRDPLQSLRRQPSRLLPSATLTRILCAHQLGETVRYRTYTLLRFSGVITIVSLAIAVLACHTSDTIVIGSPETSADPYLFGLNDYGRDHAQLVNITTTQYRPLSEGPATADVRTVQRITYLIPTDAFPHRQVDMFMDPVTSDLIEALVYYSSDRSRAHAGLDSLSNRLKVGATNESCPPALPPVGLLSVVDKAHHTINAGDTTIVLLYLFRSPRASDDIQDWRINIPVGGKFIGLHGQVTTGYIAVDASDHSGIVYSTGRSNKVTRVPCDSI